jgi:hypothetical protein
MFCASPWIVDKFGERSPRSPSWNELMNKFVVVCDKINWYFFNRKCYLLVTKLINQN